MVRNGKLVIAVGLALGLLACGGDDDNDGGKKGGPVCEGAADKLAGSCLIEGVSCQEFRGALKITEESETTFEYRQDCENQGGTWKSDKGCPSSAKASGACVASLFGVTWLTYEMTQPPEVYQAECEELLGLCYIAP
jgi:hypothetical protein